MTRFAIAIKRDLRTEPHRNIDNRCLSLNCEQQFFPFFHRILCFGIKSYSK